MPANSNRPWRRRVIRMLYIIAVLIVLGLGYLMVMGYFNNGTVKYEITAKELDSTALASYPQKLVEQGQAKGQPVYLITTHSGSERVQSGPVISDYPEELEIYLLPSAKIESDSAEVGNLAETIAPGDTDCVTIAQAASRWTAKNISYDFKLSREIWNGDIDTQSALETLSRGRGTCSEYANVFIAIMRSKGIPARFVMGKIYLGSYHSWAEIWLDGQGWVPVDPQRGSLGISARHIKLFAGTDFVDIGVPLQHIEVKIKRLGRVQP